MIDDLTLRELSALYLNEYGQNEVEKCIVIGRQDLAQVFIAGAMDTLFEKGKLKNTERAYELLDMSTDELVRYGRTSRQ